MAEGASGGVGRDAIYNTDEALAKDQEYKQIEAEMSHRIVERLELGPH